MIESTQGVGDALNWMFRLVPTFCLTNSVMFAAGRERIIFVRSLPEDDFAIVNMGGDLLMLGIHFALCTLVLILLEGCLIKSCR